MKITYVSSSTIPSRAANSVHVVKMCEAFAKNGNNVTLYAIKGEGASSLRDWYGTSEEFSVCYTPRTKVRVLGALGYAYRLHQMVNSKPLPDLFYGRFIYGLASLAGTGVPLIFEAHTLPPNNVQARVERWLFRQKNFKRLVVISQALKEDYQRIVSGIDPDRIVVAHDGASFLTVDEASQFNWPGRERAIQLGYVGHLYPGKGVEMVVDLARSMPMHDFHVVGGLERDLERWRAHSLPNLFFHGFVPHSQLSAYYSRMDILLAPMKRKILVEGKTDIGRWTSPLKIFEYMAAGKAIIASDIPVLREILSHGVTAELVPPDDLGAWQQAVAATVSLDKRKELASNAFKEFSKRYTWEKRAAFLSSLV